MLALVAAHAVAADSRPLRSAGERDYPPYAIVTADGNAAGLGVDTLKAAVERAGLSVEIAVGPWAQMQTRIEVFTPVSLTLGSAAIGFGGVPESIDQRLGNEGEYWSVHLRRYVDLDEIPGLPASAAMALVGLGLGLIGLFSAWFGLHQAKPLNRIAAIVGQVVDFAEPGLEVPLRLPLDAVVDDALALAYDQRECPAVSISVILPEPAPEPRVPRGLVAQALLTRS